jgi:hypothetical protein
MQAPFPRVVDRTISRCLDYMRLLPRIQPLPKFFRMYAPSWLESVKSAKITNFVIGAMDPPTSLTLPSLMPDDQCFNARVDHVQTSESVSDCT